MITKDILKKMREFPPDVFLREAVKEILRFLRYRVCRKTYSQAGEDRAIIRGFAAGGGVPAQGFYVDVGAHEPVQFNNTYLFYMKGWRGINIEPIPSLYREFCALRPLDININCGVWSEDGDRMFYEMCPSNQSTFLANEVDAAKAHGSYVVETKLHKIRTLNSILVENNVNRIDFLTIDAEGAELEILKGFDFDKYKPRILCVETTTEGSGVTSLVENKGYVCTWKGELSSIWRRGASDEVL